MSATSQPKQSRRTPKDSQPTTPDDVLAMVQATLELVANTAGLKVQRTNIHNAGHIMAAIIVDGALWDKDGKLVPIIANTANTEE